MPSVMIYNICNQRCLQCPNPILIKHGNPQPTTEEDIIRQIDEKTPTTDSIVFSGGGESTLVKNLPQMIQYAKKRGAASAILETNGMMLSYPDYVKQLKESGLDQCIVSLHSHREDVSDYITQTPGSFRLTMAGVANLRSYGIPMLCVLHTICSLNYQDLREYFKFAHRILRAEKIGLGFVRPNADVPTSEQVTTQLSVVRCFLHEAFRYAGSHRIGISVAAGCGIPLCFLSGYERFSCELFVYATYGAEEHRIQSYAHEKIKDNRCASCSLDICCSGVHKSYAKLYGTFELSPQQLGLQALLREVKARHQ